jgi:hypothetical protein
MPLLLPEYIWGHEQGDSSPEVSCVHTCLSGKTNKRLKLLFMAKDILQ